MYEMSVSVDVDVDVMCGCECDVCTNVNIYMYVEAEFCTIVGYHGGLCYCPTVSGARVTHHSTLTAGSITADGFVVHW